MAATDSLDNEMCQVKDTVLDKVYFEGTYRMCKSFLRRQRRKDLEYMDIVSWETGRCLSWVL
jgi:hypothetical protein